MEFFHSSVFSKYFFLIRNLLQKWRVNWPRICINMNKNPFLNNINQIQQGLRLFVKHRDNTDQEILTREASIPFMILNPPCKLTHNLV